jgi:hypothetical protein
VGLNNALGWPGTKSNRRSTGFDGVLYQLSYLVLLAVFFLPPKTKAPGDFSIVPAPSVRILI